MNNGEYAEDLDGVGLCEAMGVGKREELVAWFGEARDGWPGREERSNAISIFSDQQNH